MLFLNNLKKDLGTPLIDIEPKVFSLLVDKFLKEDNTDFNSESALASFSGILSGAMCVSIIPEDITNAIKGISELYHNPTPVVVALIPVLIERGSRRLTKLLAVRRNIDSKIGELALPGGYQEIEPVLSALFREVKEETDLAISVQSEEALVLSTPDNSRILMFFIANPKLESEINFSFENDETQELCLIDDSSALAFPLHEKAVKWFYKKIKMEK